jgi:hypothetical protein
MREWTTQRRKEEELRITDYELRMKNEELKKLLALGHSPLARRIKN